MQRLPPLTSRRIERAKRLLAGSTPLAEIALECGFGSQQQAVLEKGVYAPKLALIPEVGKSYPAAASALLGFSPVLNGITDVSTGQDQGFAASLSNGGIDPINIFPIDPDNGDSSETNNYSPL